MSNARRPCRLGALALLAGSLAATPSSTGEARPAAPGEAAWPPGIGLCDLYEIAQAPERRSLENDGRWRGEPDAGLTTMSSRWERRTRPDPSDHRWMLGQAVFRDCDGPGDAARLEAA